MTSSPPQLLYSLHRSSFDCGPNAGDQCKGYSHPEPWWPSRLPSASVKSTREMAPTFPECVTSKINNSLLSCCEIKSFSPQRTAAWGFDDSSESKRSDTSPMAHEDLLIIFTKRSYRYRLSLPQKTTSTGEEGLPEIEEIWSCRRKSLLNRSKSLLQHNPWIRLLVQHHTPTIVYLFHLINRNMKSKPAYRVSYQSCAQKPHNI